MDSVEVVKSVISYVQMCPVVDDGREGISSSLVSYGKFCYIFERNLVLRVRCFEEGIFELPNSDCKADFQGLK